ncbi:GNAT family N-acetyltransferase [Streptomyces alboflavus]|uniref:GNAT family N-acetyltransferase n=1 Tax=Streptomyces alboflavus TaxID=67267 RepID=UPI0036CDD484
MHPLITETEPLTDGVVLRPASLDDAEVLARAVRRSRDHLSPWDPERPESYYTTEGQAERLRAQAEKGTAGLLVPWLLWDGGAEEVAGAITLSHMSPAPLLSANLGYWIDVTYAGRGLATAATTAVCRIADERLGLHRVEAGTLLDNAASQRVLAKCGFEEFAFARAYLHINGAWRDHRLFQRILNDRTP